MSSIPRKAHSLRNMESKSIVNEWRAASGVGISLMGYGTTSPSLWVIPRLKAGECRHIQYFLWCKELRHKWILYRAHYRSEGLHFKGLVSIMPTGETRLLASSPRIFTSLVVSVFTSQWSLCKILQLLTVEGSSYVTNRREVNQRLDLVLPNSPRCYYTKIRDTFS